MSNEPKIIVIGASGIVGNELISILLEHGIAPERICATASASSAGKATHVGGTAFTLQLTDQSLFNDRDLVFQCATNAAALEWAPIAIQHGATVIDCSSAYRMDPEVPLVIPSVNLDAIANHTLIASPNCTTIVLLTAIHRLTQELDVGSIQCATYQALSGAGREGLDALERESAGESPSSNSIFPEPCAFNVFCHESTVDSETGFNGEESKVIQEVHKITSTNFDVIPTCMRVPVKRVHTEAITITLKSETTQTHVLNCLEQTLNVVVLNEEGHFPTAIKATSGDTVLVGHVRVTNRAVSLVACGDQIRIGAALNAFRIAEAIEHNALADCTSVTD